MTWWEIEPLAKGGVAVRRAVWAATKMVIFKPGLGTTRAVAVMRVGSVEAVITSTDFTAAEFEADDWLPI